MGMLERMISEAIRRETGFNPRRLIRKIGGGNLLLAGGAALAGGLMAQQMGKGGASATSSPSSAAGGVTLPPTGSSRPPAELPPLPPTPVPQTSAATTPADLPPLPGQAEASAAVSEDSRSSDGELTLSPALRFAITRTMVAAALADGHLDSSEKELIDQQLGEGEFDQAQAAQIRRDLVVPPNASELASILPSGEDPEVLLQFAVLSARAHGQISERERTWLQGLATALRLERTAVDRAERELFGGGE